MCPVFAHTLFIYFLFETFETSSVEKGGKLMHRVADHGAASALRFSSSGSWIGSSTHATSLRSQHSSYIQKQTMHFPQ